MDLHELHTDNTDNQLLPFLRVNDAEYDVCRKTVEAIRNADMREFCLEPLPRKGPGEQQWRDDTDVILTEAGMYGWRGGVRFGKYLLDHFMVRGVNCFSGHDPAGKAFPDTDNPPHSFAHGNNPQDRYLGALIQYGERVCGLISGGRIDEKLEVSEFMLTPECTRLRFMHYFGDPELYYLFNEGDCRYDGVLSLPRCDSLYEYDAWNDQTLNLDHWNHDNKSHINLSLDSGRSMLIVRAQTDDIALSDALILFGEKTELTNFTQSVAKSTDYPNFTKRRVIDRLESYSMAKKRFSGYIRYETVFSPDDFKRIILEITDAFEGVEVSVNGKSAGLQVVPAFVFDLTQHCVSGENGLVIEVATTAERERGILKKTAPTGIVGAVRLYIDKR